MIEPKQVQELGHALERHGVLYLFIGKTGAILHGFPDMTQDADVFVLKDKDNGKALVAALRELGFEVRDDEAEEVVRGKDFIQMRHGPFDLDLVFAPDGIEGFEPAWRRGRRIAGLAVCSLDDIINSKKAANRSKDHEALPRLGAFRDYLRERGVVQGERLPLLETKHSVNSKEGDTGRGR